MDLFRRPHKEAPIQRVSRSVLDTFSDKLRFGNTDSLNTMIETLAFGQSEDLKALTDALEFVYLVDFQNNDEHLFIWLFSKVSVANCNESLKMSETARVAK